jgi:hypothetical protein
MTVTQAQAERARSLRALADSAWLSAARWGRWEAAVPQCGPVAALAGQSARVAEVVAVARGVRAAKMA